jgi:hypothetical protein
MVSKCIVRLFFIASQSFAMSLTCHEMKNKTPITISTKRIVVIDTDSTSENRHLCSRKLEIGLNKIAKSKDISIGTMMFCPKYKIVKMESMLNNTKASFA